MFGGRKGPAVSGDDSPRRADARWVPEDEYRLLVEMSADVLAHGDTAGVLQYVSPAVTHLLGYSPEDLIGTPVRRLVHPDDVPTVAATQLTLLDAGEEPHEVRARLLCADGNWRWVSSKGRNLMDADGRVVGTVATWRDVTAQLATERELVESEHRYRLLAERGSDLVFRGDVNAVLQWVSPSASSVLGRSPDDMVGHPIAEFMHPEDIAAMRRASAAANKGETVRYRARVRHARGTWRWMEVAAEPVRDRDGMIVGRVGSARDVTDQVRAEEDLRQSRAQLADERARLRAVADSELDPRVQLDPVRDPGGTIVDFTYADANPAALTYLDRDSDELLGARLLDLFPGQADSGLFARYVDAIESGVPLILDSAPLHSEIRHAERRLDFRGVAAGGSLNLTWRDVTERFEAAAALQRSEEHYRLLAENATDVVYRMSADGTLEWVSESVEQMMGYPREQVVGRSALDFVAPDDADAAQAAMVGVLDGRLTALRQRLRTADGSTLWADITGRVVRDDSGAVVAVDGGWRDVTEQHAQLEQLADEQARLAAILHAELEPHVYLEAVRDDRGTIVDFTYRDTNDAACAYLGMAREDLEGARVLDLLPGQAGSGMLAMYAASVESGEPLSLNDYAYPHEILASERRYDIRAVKVGDGLSFAWRDVTDRYAADAALAASEARFRMLAENLGDILVELDLDQNLTFVSDVVTGALGYLPQDLVGTPLLDLIHPEDQPTVLAAAQTSHEARDGVAAARVRLRRSDGEYRWMDGVVREVRDPSGTPLFAVATLRDIDDAVKTEALLQRQAATDPLTGLVNRRELFSSVGRMLRHTPRTGKDLAVMFIDLDKLKPINDSCGHAAGDAVIATVARRMHETVRADDVVGRLGGDEFVVVLTGITTAADATRIADNSSTTSPHPCRATAT